MLKDSWKIRLLSFAGNVIIGHSSLGLARNFIYAVFFRLNSSSSLSFPGRRLLFRNRKRELQGQLCVYSGRLDHCKSYDLPCLGFSIARDFPKTATMKHHCNSWRNYQALAALFPPLDGD